LRGDREAGSGRCATRWGEGDESIGVHVQHGDPGGHIFESTVGRVPVEHLAGQSGQFRAGAPGVLGNEAADLGDFRVTEIATAVARSHELSARGTGSLGGAVGG
jgi:hypothetical protein